MSTLENASSVSYTHLDLNGEGLVKLPKIDVARFEAGALQQFWNGEYGTDSHFVGIAAGDLEAAEDQFVWNAKLISALARHDERGGCAVGKLRRISGGDASLAAGRIEVRLQREQAIEGGVGAIAFVLIGADLFFGDHFAGFLVEHGADCAHGSDFFREKTFLLGASSALLAEERVFVLGLTADFVALGYDFGSFAHHHVGAGKFLEQAGIGVVVARHQRDTFDATCDDCIARSAEDLIRGLRDGLKAGRAETVESESADGSRQTGQQSGDSGNVVTLRTVRLSTTENDVFDFAGIELRCFAQHILNAMRGKFFGTRQVERSTK